MQNKIKAFTFVELIIAILIIGILAIVSIPVYRGYVKRSMSTEARNLLSDINVGEKDYYYRTGKLYDTSGNKENYSAKIGVDSRKNKYFKTYSIGKTEANETFTAITSYNNKSVTLKSSTTGKPEIIDNFTSQAA